MTRDTDLKMNSLSGKRVVVMGLGNFGGGVGVSRWLCAQGAQVTVTDSQPQAELQSALEKIKDLPVRVIAGGHPFSLLDSCDLLVVNPAVNKSQSDFYLEAVRRQIAISTEINLFLERCPATIIGVTGSVGKSTTTAMIHTALAAIYEKSGRGKCWMGGNIGQSLLADLVKMTAADVVVLELSSFMLEDTPLLKFSPHVAVVTNLVGNHLDRHGTLANYAKAKQNILRFQKSNDFAILNSEDPVVAGWGNLTAGRALFYGVADRPPLELGVPGRHNQSNARAALAVIGALGLSEELPAALAALRAFRGLPHRLELVHSVQLKHGNTTYSVQWFNDSKATTPESALIALDAFIPGSFVCIIGGYNKHADMTKFTYTLAARCAGVLGTGDTGPAMVQQVLAHGRLTESRCMVAKNLEDAMRTAHQWVRTDPAVRTILLSPGCASYGLFTNYEQRGAVFTQLARTFNPQTA